jgi:hypothetical protein
MDTMGLHVNDDNSWDEFCVWRLLETLEENPNHNNPRMKREDDTICAFARIGSWVRMEFPLGIKLSS